MEGITIREMLKDLASLPLELVGGKAGLNRKITTTDVNRPGLALAGYLEYFAFKRIQILGKTEISYLAGFDSPSREKILKSLFNYKIPCFIVANRQKAPQELIKLSNTQNVPVLSTPIPTNKLVTHLMHYLEDKFAPKMSIHGSLMDLYGVGVLMLGRSGAGKSECALDLIERGHRLVADDVVEIRRKNDELIGSRAELIRHHMEIRGLGIINIKDLFGVSSICEQKKIDLIVMLEDWKNGKEYDRLGLDESTYKILDVDIPQVIIPVRPGRNISVIIEVAAMNQRLKQMGYHSARKFNQELLDWIQDKGRSHGDERGEDSQG